MKKIIFINLSCIFLIFVAVPAGAAFRVSENLWLIANLAQDQAEEMISSELLTVHTSTSTLGFRWRLPRHFFLTPTYEIKYRRDRLSPHLKKEVSTGTGLSLYKKLGKFNYVGDINVTARYKATDLTNKLNEQGDQRTGETSLTIQLVPGYHWRWTFGYTTKDANKVFSQGGSEYRAPRIELYRRISRKSSFALGHKWENQKNFDTAGNLSSTYKKDIPVIKFWRIFTDKLRGYGRVQQTYETRRDGSHFVHKKTTTVAQANCWYKIRPKWKIMARYQVTNTRKKVSDPGQPVDKETTTDILGKCEYKMTPRWSIMTQYHTISAQKRRSSNREITTLELGYTWRLNTKALGYIYIKPIIGYEYTDYFSKERDDFGRSYFYLRAWG